MTTKDDATLLQEYARDRAEPAFAELVRRHLNFVYAAALRQVNGDRALAEDVAQAVFADLARKASDLARHRALAGWLFTSTRYTAAKAVRSEQRRRAREQEAQRMHEDAKPAETDAAAWERLRPLLDTALNELNERDRLAILLRYLQGCDYAQVGERLQVSDNAARMCADRALEKLRDRLARRGIRSTTAALAFALAAEAAVAAPAGVAGTITTAAVTMGGTGVLTILGLTKLQWAAVGTVVLAGAGTEFAQLRAQQDVRAALAALPVAPATDSLAAQRADLAARAAAQAAVPVEVSAKEWADLQEAATLAQAQLERDARQARAAAAAARLEAQNEALPLNKLDRPPQPTGTVAPVYPAALRAASVAGSVVVEFVIDRDGRVRGAKVLRSSHREFEAPTLAALEQWKFAPGAKGGRAVSTRVSQMFQYVPDNRPPPPAAPWF